MDGWVGRWSEKTKVIPNSTQLKLKLKLELSLAILGCARIHDIIFGRVDIIFIVPFQS